MSTRMPFVMVVLVGMLNPGCAREEGRPAGPPPAAKPAEPSILGEWTTSNAPELANMATKMNFRPSGELYLAGPLTILGKTMTYKDDDGKEKIAPYQGTGTWTREGDRLTLQITGSNVQGGGGGDPSSSRIVKLTDTQLVLDRDGKVTAFFRIEPPKDAPAPASPKP